MAPKVAGRDGSGKSFAARRNINCRARRPLLPDAQRHLIELIHGLRIRYDLGAHPLAGTFAADAVEHLHNGHGVLLAGPDLRAVADPWADRVRRVHAALARWFGSGKLSV
jgi:hypothetical protein